MDQTTDQGGSSSLDLRIAALEQQLKPLQGASLPQLIETMINMANQSLRSTLKEYHDSSERDSLRSSEALQDLRENFNGQKVRIDRQVGTMDDLLKRFEAWKTVGNEMGEELKVQTNTVVELGEIVKVQGEIQAVHTKNITVVKDFLYDLRELIEDATGNLEADESELDEACEESEADEPITVADVDGFLQEQRNNRQDDINKEVEERLELHMQMLAALTRMSADIKTFVTEVKEILGARMPGDEATTTAVPPDTGGVPS